MKQILIEQRLLFAASMVLLVLALGFYWVPMADAATTRFLWGTCGKTAVFAFVLSVAWQPLRKLWCRPWGKSLAIGLLLCILVIAIRPRAIVIVGPIVFVAVSLLTAISSWSRWLK